MENQIEEKPSGKGMENGGLVPENESAGESRYKRKNYKNLRRMIQKTPKEYEISKLICHRRKAQERALYNVCAPI